MVAKSPPHAGPRPAAGDRTVPTGKKKGGWGIAKRPAKRIVLIETRWHMQPHGELFDGCALETGTAPTDYAIGGGGPNP